MKNRRLAVFAAMFALAALALANPFPPLWQNGTGPAVHYPPVGWPSEPADPVNCGANCGDWIPYTRFGRGITDARTQDASNGGTAPQNYVNVASSCTDKTRPSIYYYLHRAADPNDDVLMFRWRVEQPANNYATGPSAGNYSSSNPWSSALWTVLFDVDGTGYRSLAAHLNGSSGAPAEAIDVLAGIWSNTPNQSLDYTSDPNVHLLGHNPTAFIGNTGKILNYQDSLAPTESWANGANETSWDYGTTRAKKVTTSPCNEYFIDYQIPVAILDASGVGGPKITRDTPLSMLFCTANSLTNPFQKDCAINRTWVASSVKPAPFGDYISFNKTEPYQHPIVSSVTATPPNTCPGNYTLTAKVQDALALQSGVVVSSVQRVDFYYWQDRNGDGTADAGDTGSIWARIAPTATHNSTSLTDWTTSWDASALPKGKYLIGVQALDDADALDDDMTSTGVDNRTFSYLPGDASNKIYISGAWTTGQQAAFPTHSPVQTPASSENWYGNPDVTGTQVAVVGTAINACGVAPTISLVRSPASVAAGGTVNFTVTVENPSSNSSTVMLSSIAQSLPDGFAYTNASTSGTGGAADPSIAGQTLTWTFGAPLTINAGASATLSFATTAASAAGAYNTSASAVTSFDSLTSTPVSIVVDSARVTLSSSPSAFSVAADGSTPLTFTLRYANDSNIAVTNAQIVNALAAGTTYDSCSGGAACDYSGGNVTFTLGSLSAGATGSVTYTLTVPSNYSTTSLVSSGTLSATAPDSSTVSSSASTTIAVTGIAVAGTPAFTLTKTAGGVSIAPGGNVTYTLIYENYGTASASNVVLTDTLPAGMTFSSCSDSCSQGSGTVSWTIGTVAAGVSGSRTVTLAAAMPFTAANPITNNASITWTGGTPVLAAVNVGITGQACSTYYFRNSTANVGFDSTQKIASSSPVPVSGDTGSSVTVTAPVSGAAFLEALRFYQDPQTETDVPFDGDMTSNIYIDRANGQGLNIRATVYDYNSTTGARTQLGQSTTLFNGSTKGLLSVVVTPSGTLAKGHRLLWVYEARSTHNSQTVQVQFQYSGTVTNGISSGSTFANSNAQYCVTPPPNLTVSTTVDESVIDENTTPTLTYTTRYANTGGAQATNLSLLHTLPSGFTSCQYSTNNVSWSACSAAGSSPPSHTQSIASLAAGGSGTFYVRSTVPAGTTAPATLTATTALSSTQTNQVSSSASTEVRAASVSSGPAALAVSFAVNRTSAAPGNTAQYSVTVVNTGGSAATNVVVANTVPAAAYFSYVSGSCSTCLVSGNTLTWPTLGSLAAGASQTYAYSMLVGSNGLPAGITTISDSASATADGPIVQGSNSVDVMVNGNPSLNATLVPTPSTGLRPGDAITYTLTVSNTGAADAAGVTAHTPIPTYTRYTGPVSTSQGSAAFNAIANAVDVPLGTIPSGASASATFAVAINSPLSSGSTPISATALVSASNASQLSASANVSASAAPTLVVTNTAPASIALPTAILTSAASGTTLFVNRTNGLEIGQLVKVGGTVARITAMGARSLVVDTPANAINGTPVYGAVTLSMSYRNDGDADASGTTLEEDFPAGLGYYDSIPTATWSPIAGNSGSVQWNLGTLGVGAIGTAQVIAFPTGATGSFNSVATLGAANASDATASATTIIGGLTITKSTSTAVRSAGQDARYVITATNSLGSPATATIADVLPSGFAYQASSATVGGLPLEPTFDADDSAHTRPIWSNVIVPASGSLAIAFKADIDASTGPAAYQNEVEVDAPASVGVMTFDPLVTTAEDVTVLPPAAGMLKGYVFKRAGASTVAFDAATDQPLSGVEVQIHGATYDCAAGTNCYVAYTDANGYFEQVVGAASWIVSVVKPSGDLQSAWTQTVGQNDDTLVVLDQGEVTDENGFNAGDAHIVTATTGAHGSISPASRTVDDGDTTTFTVTPDTGYGIDAVSGCGGSLSGTTFTTAAVTADCAVSASFALSNYIITASAGTGGSIGPASANVAHDQTTSFTVTPSQGYSIASVTGCGGSLTGTIYTTGAITGACAVSATFSLNSYTVSASAGSGGSIGPASAIVSHGGATSFTVTPGTGYQIGSISGCSGSLSGNTYTTGTITGACAVTATFNQIIHTVTASAGTGGTISPTLITVPHGMATGLTVSPNAGYSIAGVSGCGGSLSGTTFTTDMVTASCAVSVAFTRIQHTVTASAGTGGSISPTSRQVNEGDTTTLTVTPASGYQISSVSGCGGSLSGTTFTTAAIASACAVNATFARIQHTVTAIAGAGGSISPASSQVNHGDTLSLTLTPASGYSVDSVTGCGGSLTGATFTTASISADCAIAATFSQNQHVVTAIAGSGGSITPPSSTVNHGAPTTLTVTPNAGYAIDAVSGCGGSLSGTTFTTGAITATCTINATFVHGDHTVTATAGTGGTISPASALVADGDTTSFSVTPNSGYRIAPVAGCSGTLSSTTFTTGAITGDCGVTASFERIRHTVTATAGSGGSITPASSEINEGETTTLTVTPASGYAIDSVSGCAGALSGTTFTTGAITAACSVSAAFKVGGPRFDTPAPARVNARSLFTSVPREIAPKAYDAQGAELPVVLADDGSKLRPGRHTLTWRATDGNGRTITATQQLDVWPTVSVSQDFVLGYGSTSSFDVILNGDAPEYPFSVAFAVGGDATVGTHHTLAAGTASFASGVRKSIPFATLPLNTSAPDRHIVVTLDPTANVGERNQLDIRIVSANQAPHVTIIASQADRTGTLIARDGGPVTLHAVIEDANTSDTHTLRWTPPAGLLDSASDDGLEYTFDPATLTTGVYGFTVAATDSGNPPLSNHNSVALSVRASAPALGAGDSNGNGISDEQEGWTDAGNGIPLYLSRIPDTNVLPEDAPVVDSYLIEGDPGVRLRVGPYAQWVGTGGARLTSEHIPALVNADNFENVGGYFDVIVPELAAADGVVRIVIPQRQPIPQGATYRLWDPQTNRWFNFTENAFNVLMSAPGEPGFCPPPGSAAYTSGLKAGHSCVQVQLQDGGPNDTDGQSNAALKHLGGVGVAAAAAPPPPVVVVTGTSKGGGGGGSMNGGWLVMLVVLVCARLRGRKRIVRALACIALLPAVASADDGDDLRRGWFAGAQGMLVGGSVDAQNMDARLATRGYATDTELSGQTRFGWNVSGGHRWRYIGAELGYTDLGRLDTKISGTTPISQEYLLAIARAHPRSGEGPQASMLGYWPLSERFELTGKLGVFYWRNTMTADARIGFEDSQDRSLDAMFGVGIEYHRGPKWTASLMWQSYRLDGERLDALSVGIAYRFRRKE